MMNNSQAPMTHDEITKTTDLEVIAYYPKELSSEMAVLLRRIAYLKMKSQNTCESQIDALKQIVTIAREHSLTSEHIAFALKSKVPREKKIRVLKKNKFTQIATESKLTQ